MTATNNTRTTALIALTAALMAVSTFIRVPTPVVPFTFQPFVVLLIPMLLGPRIAFWGMFVYLGLGLMGLPIFAAGGGPGYVLQPTFGYLLSYLVAALVIGFMTKNVTSYLQYVIAGLFGLAVVYGMGVGYLYFNINVVQDKTMPLIAAISAGTGAGIFVALDIAKLIAASAIAKKYRERVSAYTEA